MNIQNMPYTSSGILIIEINKQDSELAKKEIMKFCAFTVVMNCFHFTYVMLLCHVCFLHTPTPILPPACLPSGRQNHLSPCRGEEKIVVVIWNLGFYSVLVILSPSSSSLN
jgi:hypothetical protein